MYAIVPLQILPAMLTSNVAGTVLPAWNPATSYALGERVVDPATHILYESLAGANVGFDPALNKIKWKKVGIDNRWKMFDTSIGSKTVNAGDIVVTVVPGTIVNAITIFARARAIRIRVIDPVEGEVYNQTRNMISTRGINNWASWFREPISTKKGVAILDLPSYYSASIEITLFAVSGTADCSLCVLGARTQMGRMKYGYTLSFDPWSVKTRDEWGGWTVVEREPSDATTFPVSLDRSDAQRVKDLIKSFHAKPIVYIGDKGDESTFIYGYADGFELVVNFKNIANYSFKVQGLT